MKSALTVGVAATFALVFLAPFERKAEEPVAAAARPAAKSKPARSAQPATPAQPARWGGETRLPQRPDGHYYATAQVNGQPVEFLVDTGATTVALTVEDARRAGIAVEPARFDVVGMGAGGPVRGHAVTIARIAVDGREVRVLHGVVLEGAETSLLGQAYLSRLAEVRMSGGEMILR